MTVEEALQTLRCAQSADWATVQLRYEEEYNRLQRLRETATTREERRPYDDALQAQHEAYAFLQALPGFGPVAVQEPGLPEAVQQALESPYAAIRVGAVQTLGQLVREASDLAPLAQARLAALSRDSSAAVAQAAQEALYDPRPAAAAGTLNSQVPRSSSRRFAFVLGGILLLVGGVIAVGQQREIQQLKIESVSWRQKAEQGRREIEQLKQRGTEQERETQQLKQRSVDPKQEVAYWQSISKSTNRVVPK